MLASAPMDSFLGAAAFPGPAVGRHAGSNSFVSQARFNGCIAFSNWPRADVERLLPPELELCANTSSLSDVHPVTFIFGDQTEGAMILGGFTYSVGVSYQELGMVIPFVKHRCGPYRHTYMVRMYSNYSVATWNGNMHYGFSKEMATLRWQGPVFMVTTEAGALLLHAAVEAAGDWSPGAACTLENFAATREIFSLPVLGRKANGEYVASYFGWDFAEASVRNADSCVSVDAPFLEGLTPRRYHDVPSGTFEVQGMMWRLTWPAPPRFR